MHVQTVLVDTSNDLLIYWKNVWEKVWLFIWLRFSKEKWWMWKKFKLIWPSLHPPRKHKPPLFHPPPPSEFKQLFSPHFLIFLKKIVHLVYSTLWKFSLDIVCIFKKAWNFLTKFWYSDQIFSRNIFTPLCSKSETSAHTRLTITRLYILLANVLTWCQLETSFKDTPW